MLDFTGQVDKQLYILYIRSISSTLLTDHINYLNAVGTKACSGNLQTMIKLDHVFFLQVKRTH
jgi:hypothetical protein